MVSPWISIIGADIDLPYSLYFFRKARHVNWVPVASISTYDPAANRRFTEGRRGIANPGSAGALTASFLRRPSNGGEKAAGPSPQLRDFPDHFPAALARIFSGRRNLSFCTGRRFDFHRGLIVCFAREVRAKKSWWWPAQAPLHVDEQSTMHQIFCGSKPNFS